MTTTQISKPEHREREISLRGDMFVTDDIVIEHKISSPNDYESKHEEYSVCTRRTCCIATPISAGFIVTCTLACLSASIFSVAPPLPPAMIAPACPIRLPGGAVKPAINAAHGLASEPYNITNIDSSYR